MSPSCQSTIASVGLDLGLSTASQTISEPKVHQQAAVRATETPMGGSISLLKGLVISSKRWIVGTWNGPEHCESLVYEILPPRSRRSAQLPYLGGGLLVDCHGVQPTLKQRSAIWYPNQGWGLTTLFQAVGGSPAFVLLSQHTHRPSILRNGLPPSLSHSDKALVPPCHLPDSQGGPDRHHYLFKHAKDATKTHDIGDNH